MKKQHYHKPFLIRAAQRITFRFQNYRNITWIIGSGRSGTTWVSELINFDRKLRDMFEPFHPFFVPAMRDLRLHEYIRPNQRESAFDRKIEEVFSGNLYNSRVDFENRGFLYDGLIIKDIFANLMAPYVQRRLPHVKIIFLIRNPFSVALSKMKNKDWIWMNDPMDFSNQKYLFADYLKPFEDLIKKSNISDFEKHVLIWAVVNYIPLKELKHKNTYILFYEDLYLDPSKHLPPLIEFARGSTQDIGYAFGRLNVSSRFTGDKGTVNLGKSPVTSWKQELSRCQIENGTKILERFGLDKLYDSHGMPQAHEIANLSL